jgi:hypothetical protein
MAVVEKTEIMDQLSESISEKLEERRKKTQPIPEVYSSGMRGGEKPPHLREKKKAKAAGEDAPEERWTKDGKRVVTFKAKPKVRAADEIASLKEQVAQLTKRLDGDKGAAANKGDKGDKGARRIKVAIA